MSGKKGLCFMDFYKRMELVCERIPAGRTASYGQIALLCGKPGNARQVGYALRRGRAGEHVPAHRIVNAKGILSGAEAFDTPETQKRLLEAEGVLVKRTDAGWQVDLREYGWVSSMEEAEELYRVFQEKGI